MAIIKNADPTHSASIIKILTNTQIIDDDIVNLFNTKA